MALNGIGYVYLQNPGKCVFISLYFTLKLLSDGAQSECEETKPGESKLSALEHG